MKTFNILEWLYEYWVPVKDYEELYEVSNWGRVRSLDHYILSKNGNRTRFKAGTIRKTKQSKNGYEAVILYKDGGNKDYLIHRIVAQAFLLNPNNLPQVNHKDENKLSNCVWNLEWCNYEYNCNYGERNNKISYKVKKPVVCFKNGIIIKQYESLQEASILDGYCYSSISEACNGKVKTYRGLEWRFANETD